MVSKTAANRVFGAISKALAPFHPSEQNAEQILAWIVPQIKEEDLKKSLSYFAQWQLTGEEKWENLWDPVPGLFSQFSQLNEKEWIVRKYGREWWPYIEKYIANPAWIIKYISSQNKNIGRMLSTSLGQTYMQYYARKMHAFFKTWLWLFPRYHNNCGGVMKYGLITPSLNLWGFYCKRCGARYTVDKVEENSYQGRRHKAKGNNYAKPQGTQ
jgi:hypothetical protein